MRCVHNTPNYHRSLRRGMGTGYGSPEQHARLGCGPRLFSCQLLVSQMTCDCLVKILKIREPENLKTCPSLGSGLAFGWERPRCMRQPQHRGHHLVLLCHVASRYTESVCKSCNLSPLARHSTRGGSRRARARQHKRRGHSR
jgi:hypothetical protein